VNPEGAVPEVNSENNSSDPPLTVEFVRRNVFNILFSIDINFKPDFSIGFNAHRWMAKISPTARVNYEPFNFIAGIFAREKYLAFLEITTDLVVHWSLEGGDPENPGKISQKNDKVPFAYTITLEVGSSVSKQGRLLAQAAARVLGLETQRGFCDPFEFRSRSSPGQVIRDVGFDPETKQIKLSRQNHNSLASCSNPWVSPGTYENLFETNLTSKLRIQKSAGSSMSSLLTLASPPGKRQSQPAEYLILSGAVGPNGSAPRLDPVYRLESSIAPLPLPDAGEWGLELAGDGGLPSRHCVDEDLDGGEFVAKVPYRAGTQRIALTQMGQEVVARAASANAPSLQITSPTAGANLDASAPLTITWMASDADGDGLVFAVLQSADGGESWFPLTFDLTDAQFTFDGARNQGGGDVFFRVLASDGFHTTEQVVGPVTVTQRPALQVDDRVRLGSAAVGQPSEGFVTVTGAGTGPVVIEAVASDSPGFGVDPNTLPLTLLVGMSRKLFVEFTPSGVGVETAMLTLTTNSPDQPNVNVLVEAEGLDPAGPILDTDLTGESSGGGGGSPSLTLNSSSVTYGGVSVGRTNELTLIVTNGGGGPLTVESISSSDPQFRAAAPETPFTVSVGGKQSVKVHFTPSSLDSQSGTLTFSSNDPTQPAVEVAVSGRGVEGAHIQFSDSFDRTDANCSPAPADNALGGGGRHGYLPLFISRGRPLGARLVSGALENPGMNYAGVQFSDDEQPCFGGTGEDIGEDANIRVDLLVPGDNAGNISQAGLYFRTKSVGPGSSILGGMSAGYWVQLHSTGQIKLKLLNPEDTVAATRLPSVFDNTVMHTLEVSVRRNCLWVALDGVLQVFDQDGARFTSVPIPAVWDRPPAVGVNEGAAGIAFGAEDNPDQIGGQRADNLVVTDYESLNELPVQE